MMEKRVVKVLGFTAREQQIAIKTNHLSFTLNEGRDVEKEMISTIEEFLLVRLVLSINRVGNQLGRALDLNLKSIQIEVLGELLGSDKRNDIGDFSFKKVSIVVKPNSDVSIVSLKEWMDELKKRCPVFINFHQKFPTILTLVKEYEQINVA